jgi:hypothetical protein
VAPADLVGPMRRGVDRLNVAAATAVACGESGRDDRCDAGDGRVSPPAPGGSSYLPGLRVTGKYVDQKLWVGLPFRLITIGATPPSGHGRGGGRVFGMSGDGR